MNVGVEPYLVAASLVGVLAQRLVRKICTSCKEAYDPPENIRRVVEKMSGPVETFYRGKGCPKCRKTGFSGRIGIYELLVLTDELRQRISNNVSVDEIRQAAIESGMTILRQDGMDKVKAGITTVEEVLSVTTG